MKPPSSAEGSVDFALAKAAKSSPFARRSKICCALVGELTTIIRKPTGPGVCQASAPKHETQIKATACSFAFTKRLGCELISCCSLSAGPGGRTLGVCKAKRPRLRGLEL